MIPNAVFPLAHTRPLSQRERLLVRAVTDGCSNKEIAARLGLSVQTVKNQLSMVYEKLAVSTRLELAVFANRHREIVD